MRKECCRCSTEIVSNFDETLFAFHQFQLRAHSTQRLVVPNCQLSSGIRGKCWHPNAENSIPLLHLFVIILIYRIFMVLSSYFHRCHRVEMARARQNCSVSNEESAFDMQRSLLLQTDFPSSFAARSRAQRPHIKYVLMNLLVPLNHPRIALHHMGHFPRDFLSIFFSFALFCFDCVWQPSAASYCYHAA